MKTQDEIVARIKADEVTDRDMFGFEREALLVCLDYKHAKPFLKDSATEQDWEGFPTTPTEHILDYLPFAITKAEDHRGLSASRSVMKMQGWLWVDDNYDKIDWEDYQNYGAPIIRQIVTMYAHDMELSPEFLRMSVGKMCQPNCMEGCG